MKQNAAHKLVPIHVYDIVTTSIVNQHIKIQFPVVNTTNELRRNLDNSAYACNLETIEYFDLLILYLIDIIIIFILKIRFNINII